ncbi:MAG: hypothetical protein O3A82_03210 [Verrucomicrobia bacterium]|nr:hypothetical protein [Verrucomicrobiota bacterium]
MNERTDHLLLHTRFSPVPDAVLSGKCKGIELSLSGANQAGTS